MWEYVIIFLLATILIFKICHCIVNKDNYRVIGVNERRETAFLPYGFLPVSDFYTINDVPVF